MEISRTILDYVLDHLWRLLGPYLVGMAFYSAVVLMAIDVVTSQHFIDMKKGIMANLHQEVQRSMTMN